MSNKSKSNKKEKWMINLHQDNPCVGLRTSSIHSGLDRFHRNVVLSDSRLRPMTGHPFHSDIFLQGNLHVDPYNRLKICRTTPLWQAQGKVPKEGPTWSMISWWTKFLKLVLIFHFLIVFFVFFKPVESLQCTFWSRSYLAHISLSHTQLGPLRCFGALLREVSWLRFLVCLCLFKILKKIYSDFGGFLSSFGSRNGFW